MFARHWMAYYSFRRFGWPKFPKSRYFQIKKLAEQYRNKQGVLAFVSVDKYIMNYVVNHALTGSNWGHAGYIYFDADGELRIKHMLNSGLNDDYLLDLMGELDGFALLWIPLKDQPEAMRRLERLNELRDEIEYDYEFELNPILPQGFYCRVVSGNGKIRLYCSEFVFAIVNGLTRNEKFEPHMLAGRWVFEPDDLFSASEVLFSESY